MVPLWHPLRFLLVALAGWINQQQRDVIDYLQEENRILTRAARTSAASVYQRSANSVGRESQHARSTRADGDPVVSNNSIEGPTLTR